MKEKDNQDVAGVTVYTVKENIPYECCCNIYSTTSEETANRMADRLNTLIKCSGSDYYYSIDTHRAADELPSFMNHNKLLFEFYIIDEFTTEMNGYHDFSTYDSIPLEGKWEQYYDPLTGEHEPEVTVYVWADSREEAERIAMEKYIEMKNNGEIK